LGKLSLIGKDLDDFSLETVKMFYEDAVKSGYALEAAPVGARVAVRNRGRF
jgi:transaldolase